MTSPTSGFAASPRLQIPSEAFTADLGLWTANRLLRVATSAPPDEVGGRDGHRLNHGERPKADQARQLVAAPLVCLVILLSLFGPVFAAGDVFMSNDTAESEVTYVVQVEAAVTALMATLVVVLPPDTTAARSPHPVGLLDSFVCLRRDARRDVENRGPRVSQ
jgi:hypothetical protein